MVKKRFNAKETTIHSGLRLTMGRFNATSLKLVQDIMSPSAEVIFDRNGRRYSWKCNKYDTSLENLRAIQLSLDYLWRITEAYGVSNEEKELNQLLDNLLLSSEATPDDSCLLLSDGNKQWFEVLGVSKDANKQDIINAFRALSKIHHPDVGGNHEDFIKLRKAYEWGLANLKK